MTCSLCRCPQALPQRPCSWLRPQPLPHPAGLWGLEAPLHLGTEVLTGDWPLCFPTCRRGTAAEPPSQVAMRIKCAAWVKVQALSSRSTNPCKNYKHCALSHSLTALSGFVNWRQEDTNLLSLQRYLSLSIFKPYTLDLGVPGRGH